MPGDSVALVEHGNVVAIGSNALGQCDLPTDAVLQGRKATQVCGGQAHSLMLLDDGSVLAFGCNARGQCDVPTGSQLMGRKVTQVAVGFEHSLMLLDDASVLAFGANQYGQCNIPAGEFLGRKATQLAAGSYHSLICLDDGSVLVCGSNGLCQCDTPNSQLRGRKVKQVAAGACHSLLLLDDGNVLGFGLNHHDQCTIPAASVLRGRKATQVAAGGHHSCLLLDDGSVMSFGWNVYGQCATSTEEQLRGRKAIQVHANAAHSLALLEDGTVLFWGCNAELQPVSAVELLPGRTAKQVTSGKDYFLLLVDDDNDKNAGRSRAVCRNRSRHSAGVDEVVYKEIQDFVASVKPTKKVSEHFQEEVPKAFPEIRPEFIDYYCNMAKVLATSRIEAGVTKDLENMEVWAIVVYTMDSRSSGLSGSGTCQGQPVRTNQKIHHGTRWCYCLCTLRYLAGVSQNFYYHLNKCLQKRDMGVIKHIENYLHFLMRGLTRLLCIEPDFAKEACRLFRGVSRASLEVIQAKYKTGLHIHWPGITSVSLDEDVAKDFACEDGPGGVIFEIWSWSARVIGDISAIPAEKEAVLLPNFRATVAEGLTQKAGEDFWVIKLVEKRKSQVYDF